MELKQIAISPDGFYIYALDEKGKLWAAPTKVPGQNGGLAVAPNWTQIKAPPKPQGQL
jgi:hypothetical protein